MLRLSWLPLILLLIGSGYAAPPTPLLAQPAVEMLAEDWPPPTVGPTLEIEGWAGIAAADSTIKLGSRVVLGGFVAGDTVRYEYYKVTGVIGSLKDSALKTVRTRAIKDSLYAPAPDYGATFTYKGCSQVERGGRTSGNVYPATKRCWSWEYMRPQPTGTMDSLIRFSSLLIRPLGPKLAADSGSACALWQATNPSTSPFVQINAKAVPACTGHDSTGAEALRVWQYCVFAQDSAGVYHKMQNSWNSPYCEDQLQSLVNEVGV